MKNYIILSLFALLISSAFGTTLAENSFGGQANLVKGESALTPAVSTNKGLVRGQILTTVQNSKFQYAAFKGIPYAEPPVKNLRFKPPVEKTAWAGVLNATSEGSMCIQYYNTTTPIMGSEDCLYLNVFTPHTQFHKPASKPVMVFIFGGSYAFGNSNASFYGPDFLVEEDVILVSLNYRLGALGFLNLHHEKASGNYGLKDQNLALKWVQKNIANFGGDPKKVTLFGQSAGAVCVDLQVLSNMSAGLISQSIAMSGTPLYLYAIQTYAEAEESAFQLGAALGANTQNKDQLLETLNKASAADIVLTTTNLPSIAFRPSIETTTAANNQEKFFSECTLKTYLSGNYSKGPRMMGFAASEALMFAQNADSIKVTVNLTLEPLKIAGIPLDLPFLNKINSLSSDDIANLKKVDLYKVIQELSDLLLVVGIDTTQRLMTLNNEYPIYYYRFSFDSKYSFHRALMGVDLDGAGHADDLPYIFYMPDAKIPLYQPDNEITRKRMVRLYTNFAKYGNPTPKCSNDKLLRITWPDSGTLGKHLDINRNLTIGLRPISALTHVSELAGLGVSPILNDCLSKRNTCT